MLQEKITRVAQMMIDMNYDGVEMVVMNDYRHIDRTKDLYISSFKAPPTAGN